MRREDSEDGALVVRLQVKEAVPGEDAVETAAEVQPTHVCDQEFMPRQPRRRAVDHARRTVDAGDAEAPGGKPRRHRRAAAAAEVQHAAAFRQPCGEARQPAFFHQRSAAVAGGIPGGGVAPVESKDIGRRIRHQRRRNSQ